MTSSAARTEPAIVRRILIGLFFAFMAVMILLPVACVFANAFRKGIPFYFGSLADPDTRSAVALTALTAAIVVPLNLVFGVAAAWAIARFNFRGKGILTGLIDLPFSVSPVISGLIFILLFGAQGVLGPWLIRHGFGIVFAPPAIILATLFVTFPFVARELIPVMKSVGTEEEEAALTLGASGWQMFWRITIPNIKWGLLYGIVLCNARAMGEFGAVSVVSGHIRGRTNTLPLQVEILYNEYNFAAAFAAASLLVFLSFATLIAKKLVELKSRPISRS